MAKRTVPPLPSKDFAHHLMISKRRVLRAVGVKEQEIQDILERDAERYKQPVPADNGLLADAREWVRSYEDHASTLNHLLDRSSTKGKNFRLTRDLLLASFENNEKTWTLMGALLTRSGAKTKDWRWFNKTKKQAHCAAIRLLLVNLRRGLRKRNAVSIATDLRHLRTHTEAINFPFNNTLSVVELQACNRLVQEHRRRLKAARAS